MSVSASHEVSEIIDQFLRENSELKVICLCTSDGFVIHQTSKGQLSAEPDKVAAVASTYSSISQSIAQQIIGSEFRVASIETRKGNFICANTNYSGKGSVLVVSADDSMSLGVLRVKTRNLALAINKVPSANSEGSFV